MPTFQSTWQFNLPEDEIGRQQAMKERLEPGLKVSLVFDDVELGEFVYSGLWDTMHAFYPLPDNPIVSASIRDALPEARKRYARRDLRGREFIQLPYTLLADIIRLDK
ncbi:MAG: hypothetical protein K2M31_08595 [Muribaculaceae bacterium]|nr:hypothetical protein [Muribaculaceae bacterium]